MRFSCAQDERGNMQPRSNFRMDLNYYTGSERGRRYPQRDRMHRGSDRKKLIEKSSHDVENYLAERSRITPIPLAIRAGIRREENQLTEEEVVLMRRRARSPSLVSSRVETRKNVHRARYIALDSRRLSGKKSPLRPRTSVRDNARASRRN